MSGRWWRAYSRARHDPKLLKLSDKDFRWWFNLVCVAADNGGALPYIRDLAAEFRTSEQTITVAIERLRLAGLFEIEGEPGPDVRYIAHNWNVLQYVSDSSSNRVKQFRQRRRNVSVTPSESETDTETDSVAKATGAHAPARDVIFAECLPWLSKRAGKDCRSLVGKWLSETRDDDAVRLVLEACEKENPVDPVSWIAARFKPRPDKAQEIRDAITRGLNS